MTFYLLNDKNQFNCNQRSGILKLRLLHNFGNVLQHSHFWGLQFFKKVEITRRNCFELFVIPKDICAYLIPAAQFERKKQFIIEISIKKGCSSHITQLIWYNNPVLQLKNRICRKKVKGQIYFSNHFHTGIIRIVFPFSSIVCSSASLSKINPSSWE